LLIIQGKENQTNINLLIYNTGNKKNTKISLCGWHMSVIPARQMAEVAKV
jgi:hypothetical protein